MAMTLADGETTADDVPTAELPPDAAATDGGIKLVIWDLDDTFWRGTLEEGGVELVAHHLTVLRTLSSRGIINSIASKNHRSRARALLEQAGLWDYFVLPQIAFLPKPELVRQVIQSCELQAPSVLFIDDNPINLNEVAHHNPGIQVATPAVLEHLLDNPRCQGAPDPQLKRLQHYHNLGKRAADRARHDGGNREAQGPSDIRVSIHHDPPVLRPDDMVADPAAPIAADLIAVTDAAPSPAPAPLPSPAPSTVRSNLLPNAATMAGQGWRPYHGALAQPSTLPPRTPGDTVTHHRLPAATSLQTFASFGCLLIERVEPDQTYTASAWVWIPAAFKGREVSLGCVGRSALHVRRASPQLRDAWQLVSVSVHVPAGQRTLLPALNILGEAGDEIHSTGWRLEAGPTTADLS